MPSDALLEIKTEQKKKPGNEISATIFIQLW